ncbi:MAG: C25 family cysteine peptidase [Candidatus Cloacimonadales bacterium]|nr:C25 family cysteine peptidase [Candidatus Cloacimonadales bacterium]
MAKRLTIIGMILMLINLNAINSKKQENIERARTGQHIIIAPEEFLTQANLFADFYWDEFQIERVVVDQQDIFDQMNGGVADPDAIREYLIEFFDDPTVWLDSSVLLMGSGTEDWNVPNDKNRIIVTEYSDDEFVLLDTDYYPDVPIGRFPAQNEDQLNLIINRNIQYITNPTTGWWRNKMLMVVDDEHKGNQLEGLTYNSGLNHTARSQDTAEVLSDAVWLDRVLGIEYEMYPNGNKPEAAQDVIDKVNEGRLIWHYIGHGNEDVLGDEEYFRASTQLQLLQNADKLPLFTAASVDVGDFSSLEYDCMAEQFLTYEFGGAIATIAPRGSTDGHSNHLLFLAFFQNMINDYNYLGAALLDAKLNCSASIGNSKLYNILGDPLLFVNPPDRDENISIVGNPTTLYYEDDVEIFGQLPNANYTFSDFKAFESEYDCYYTNTLNGATYEVDYTKFGEPYFEEEIAISGDYYETSFSVTPGIQTGEQARMISYIHSVEDDYVQYLYPITIMEETQSPDDPMLPNELSASNYPNPFNPSTTISFALPEDTNVSLSIYNLKGQLLKQLLAESKIAGMYSVMWDGKDSKNTQVSSGVYFYQLETPSKTITKRMLMLK